jgi:hypothetical protein
VFEELLKELAQALDRAGLPYMVFGGQAVLLYGEPRLTRDIDITLGVDPSKPGPVLAMIADLELRILVDDAEDFLSKTFVLPVLHTPSGVRIDFVFSLSEYERQAIARARRVSLGGVDVRFVSLEDLIVQKIIAGRPRDLHDAKNVILKNPGFDRTRVETRLQQFDQELDTHFLLAFQAMMAELEQRRDN